jgi:hypothetical protein
LSGGKGCWGFGREGDFVEILIGMDSVVMVR